MKYTKLVLIAALSVLSLAGCKQDPEKQVQKSYLGVWTGDGFQLDLSSGAAQLTTPKNGTFADKEQPLTYAAVMAGKSGFFEKTNCEEDGADREYITRVYWVRPTAPPTNKSDFVTVRGDILFAKFDKRITGPTSLKIVYETDVADVVTINLNNPDPSDTTFMPEVSPSYDPPENTSAEHTLTRVDGAKAKITIKLP